VGYGVGVARKVIDMREFACAVVVTRMQPRKKKVSSSYAIRGNLKRASLCVLVSFCGMLIRCLLIEDDADFAALVKIWLAAAAPTIDFDLHWEATLSGSLEYLETYRVDLAFLDLGLPDSQGLATLRRLESAVREVPVIVLSGENSDAVMCETINVGAEDHIVKTECDANALVAASLNAIARHFAARVANHDAPAPRRIDNGSYNASSMLC
jgi:DNA-binding response OmpR family regulator